MRRPSPPAGSPAFTLVELLVAMAVFALILVVVLNLTKTMGDVWKSSRSKVESFQTARQAFEMITRTVSQATLNTYYDYFDAAGRSARDAGFAGADHYGRQSELHFVTGKSLVPDQVAHALFFQTPRGYAKADAFQNLGSLLNACGFYIVRGPDPLRPAFLANVPSAPPNEERYRLMQFLQPSESLTVYSATGTSWFTAPLGSGSAPIEQLAPNVIALVVLPRWSAQDSPQAGTALAADYEYDSRITSGGAGAQPAEQNQLPPLIEIVLVAVDETSARRMEQENLEPPPGIFSQDTAKLDQDLAALEQFLNTHRLVYRVFRTVVPLHNSKWSA